MLDNQPHQRKGKAHGCAFFYASSMYSVFFGKNKGVLRTLDGVNPSIFVGTIKSPPASKYDATQLSRRYARARLSGLLTNTTAVVVPGLVNLAHTVRMGSVNPLGSPYLDSINPATKPVGNCKNALRFMRLACPVAIAAAVRHALPVVPVPQSKTSED